MPAAVAITIGELPAESGSKLRCARARTACLVRIVLCGIYSAWIEGPDRIERLRDPGKEYVRRLL
jgi:hypothetical protein